MTKNKKKNNIVMNKTSDVLTYMLENVLKEDGDITIRELKKLLHDFGFAFLLFIFSLPLSIPFPVPPGFTTVASLPLLFFSIQLILGYDSPWLPDRINKKTLKKATLSLIIRKSLPFLHKIEKILRPRMKFMLTPTSEKIYAIFSFICALSIAIPLPLTNFIPAAGIATLSLGFLSRDGFLMSIGYLIGILGLFVSAVVVFLGASVVYKLFSFIM